MSKKINFGSDEEFIQNYQELKSSRKMGELYGCDKSTIVNHAKKIGFDYNSVQTSKLSEQDKEYIKQNYHTKTSTELANEFNVSRGMITKVWYDAGLNGKANSKQEWNTTAQDITNQEFGFLTALYPTEQRDAGGGIIWHCKCNCGRDNCLKEKDYPLQWLKQGSAISCGTISKENLKLGLGLNFNNLTNQRFGKLTVVERAEDKNFPDGRKAVQWLCKCDCGRSKIVLSSNLVTGNTQSCGMCQEKSHGNIKIESLLTTAMIPFEREKRFDTCKDKSYLPFDFYVNNQYLIEYDGIQHFEKNDLFDYETIHQHDVIKSQWCKDNSIPLIRIPYTRYDNLCIEDLLLETSQFIEK